MSGRCRRCGGELLPGAAFCASCGQAVGSASTPVAGPGPEAAVGPEAAAGPGPKVPVGPVSPPSALSGRTTLLVIGGAVVVFVLALVVVLGGPGETKVPIPTTAAGPQPTQPGPSSPPNQPAPPGGSLRTLVKQQVGPFQLQTLKDAASLAGANERLEAVYRSADGVEVDLNLAAFPSPAAAEASRQAWKRQLEGAGFKLGEEGPVRSTTGTTLGTKSVYHAQDEVVVWTNRNLSVLAAGPTGQAVAFYDASSI